VAGAAGAEVLPDGRVRDTIFGSSTLNDLEARRAAREKVVVVESNLVANLTVDGQVLARLSERTVAKRQARN
jgi:hypothetical protein